MVEEQKDINSSAEGCSCQGNINGEKVDNAGTKDPEWIIGKLETPAGEIKQVSARLTFKDTIGSWKARFGISRMNYKIAPGLYCVGSPDGDSPVLVSANYKMSFDSLRKELKGLNAWILVLDTKGINVWCAAGKGTFGTNELIRRIRKTGLLKIMNRKVVILPQLGAPGVAAHEVQKHTGFRVVYGPVRAEDIKAFLNLGMKADKKMRETKFTFTDRIVLTPLEVINVIKPSMIVFGVLFILNAIGFGSYGLKDLYAYSGAIIAGCVLTPALLPFIPGRAFAFKGALMGLFWAVAVVGWSGINWMRDSALILILPAISSYGAMNFTGCSTYTSLSGVDREMKLAIPVMLVSVGLGAVLLIIEGLVRIMI